MSEEEWRVIPDFPDYEVSSFGNVRKARLNGSVTSHGYVRVSLMKDKKTYYRYVHQIVCEVFNGKAPRKGLHVAHWDGVRDNNRAENLRWATPHENAMDKVRHGTHMRGQRHPNSKISDAQVIDIRARRRSGESAVDIANDIGVHVETVRAIVNGNKRPFG